MKDETEWTVSERIAALAREAYNSPPETPRDEMWSEIEARLDDDGSDVVPRRSGDEPSRRYDPSRRYRIGWWVGIAAALVIGLGIGRLSLDSDPADPALAEAPVTGVRPDVPTADVPATSGDGVGEPDGRPYRAATRRHLVRSESFLAGVRVDLRDETTTPELGTWARSLLSRTRVLLASPAAREPETRRLLEDLELMLAQVVVTSATMDPTEAHIVGEDLRTGDLLYRLRSAAERNDGPELVRGDGTSAL